jgi:hypothetical protein
MEKTTKKKKTDRSQQLEAKTKRASAPTENKARTSDSNNGKRNASQERSPAPEPPPTLSQESKRVILKAFQIAYDSHHDRQS